MQTSEIVMSNGATTYAGPDAVNLFRARTLRSSIKMHQRSGMIPTRGVTITVMFQIAGQYTGKKYKRGQHDQAIADLDVWISAMTSAMPITDERTGGV